MTVSIGNKPADFRAPQCRYCGSSFIETPEGYGVCDQCDLANTFSDLYKDENGVRPRGHFTTGFKRWFVASHNDRVACMAAYDE